MDRITIPDVKIDENTTRRSVIDVAEVKKCAMQLYWHLKKIEDILGDVYDLDRLREIVQADRAGRCVVLPCKVGDTVFQVEDGEIYEMEVQSIEIDSGDPNDMSIFTDELTLEKRDFREDVYRTEREAKAALKGEQDGKETE